MPRVVKEHAVRRSELLDAAQRLIFTKGYDQMSIQDILDELHIAKGTFYHYFSSKHALLEALVQSLLDDVIELIQPIVDDPRLPAVDKIQQVFDTIGGWKSAQKNYHLTLLRVWYSDENAIARWKVRVQRVERMQPLFATIIQQGIDENTMSARDPGHTSGVVLSLIQEFIDALATAFLALEPGRDDLPRMAALVAAYTEGLARVLGIQQDMLSPVTAETLRAWMDAAVGDR
jgi:AcrR family transcriptional regulator